MRGLLVSASDQSIAWNNIGQHVENNPLGRSEDVGYDGDESIISDTRSFPGFEGVASQRPSLSSDQSLDDAFYAEVGDENYYDSEDGGEPPRRGLSEESEGTIAPFMRRYECQDGQMAAEFSQYQGQGQQFVQPDSANVKPVPAIETRNTDEEHNFVDPEPRRLVTALSEVLQRAKKKGKGFLKKVKSFFKNTKKGLLKSDEKVRPAQRQPLTPQERFPFTTPPARAAGPRSFDQGELFMPVSPAPAPAFVPVPSAPQPLNHNEYGIEDPFVSKHHSR